MALKPTQRPHSGARASERARIPYWNKSHRDSRWRREKGGEEKSAVRFVVGPLLEKSASIFGALIMMTKARDSGFAICNSEAYKIMQEVKHVKCFLRSVRKRTRKTKNILDGRDRGIEVRKDPIG